MATSAVLDGPSRAFDPAAAVSLARTLGGLVTFIGAIVLAGWLLEVPALARIVPGWTAMKANTALMLLLSGVGLVAATRPGSSTARYTRLIVGSVVLLTGGAVLAEHLLDAPLGFDELLVRDTLAPPGTRWPGRPPLIGAINLVLIGAALLAVDVGYGWRVRPTEVLSLAVGLLALVAVEGFVFGRPTLYGIPALTSIAIPAALASVALSTGLFVVRPTVGLMRSITAPGVAGATLRRILPIAIVVPVALGWLRLQAGRQGWVDEVTGVALLVTAMAICLFGLSFVTIAPLAAEEARSRAAERIASERIRRLNRVYAVLSHINHAIVRERDLSVLLERTCRIAVDQGGFVAAWVGLAPETPGAPLTLAAEASSAEGHRAALLRALSDPGFADSAPLRAIASARPIVADGRVEPALHERLADCPVHDALASAHGCRAVACFPLRSREAVRGVLVLASADPGVFDADEMRLLDELAMDVGFAMDVSRNAAERARAEAALRESQARLERAVRAGNVGLWEWGLTTSTVYYSTQWKRQLGYEDHEIAADFEAWRSRIHPADVDRVVNAVADYLNGHALQLEIEYRCRHKDGSYRQMLAHAAVLLDEQGRQVSLLGAHVDVTHQTELRAQFLQAQKMESLGRLAGGIAHDFNNLLTIINGTADLALLRHAATGQRDDDWRGVREAGERAATLTKQLLAISRKQVLQVEVLDINQVLGGLEGLLRRLIGEDVLLRVALDADAGRVRADAGHIEQVVVNLAVNARDAMPRGGVLTIETRHAEVVGTPVAGEHAPIAPGRYCVIAVSDTGEGMDDATRARAFEPFFTTKGPGKGTGLGLSTVFGIVRQSGGSIRLRSAAGAGTTFEVYLPAVTDAARRTRSEPHQTVVRGTETILVVEDEPALRLVARKILENAGYKVLVASSGEEALSVVRRAVDPIHLLMTDVVMPGMSGPALVGRLREEGARTRILYTSGYADDELLESGARDERIHFLPKPYTGTTLLRKVRDVLDAETGLAAGNS